jgi:hypothetical protein
MKKQKFILLVSFLSVTFTSCHKKDDDQPELISGLGGNLTIVAKPQHHGVPILNKTVYADSAFVKFNTQDYPGDNPALYDAIFVGDAGEDHVHVENIKPGKMYIFMTGFDSTIVQRVRGGIPVNTTQSSGELIVTVPVTE